MDALRELGYLIYDWLVDVSAEPGFLSGLLIGVAGFALVAFVVFRVKVWWGKVTAPFSPQKVSHTTSKTPAQVVGSSCSTFLLGVLAFVCIMFLLVEIVRPGTLLEVFHALGL